jgi:hypothetical protein
MFQRNIDVNLHVVKLQTIIYVTATLTVFVVCFSAVSALPFARPGSNAPLFLLSVVQHNDSAGGRGTSPVEWDYMWAGHAQRV